MTRVDRYVLRQFIVTAAFALLAFIVIFVAIDLMENLDEFLDRNATPAIIATYYFYFAPEIVKLMVPLSMLLSALFTTGRLSTLNELTALKAGGMSLYRFMAPVVLFALLVSGVSVWFNGWVVPAANHKKLQIARFYFQKNIEFVSKNNIYIQDSETKILSIGLFDDTRNVAMRVSVQEFAAGDPTTLVERHDAAEMHWNAADSSWTLQRGTERTFTASGETIRSFTAESMRGLHFSPDDIRKKQEKPDEMNYTDLGEFIGNQQRAGQDVARWLVDYYGKIAFPFSNFIVVLFGIPFSSVKRKAGLGVEFGIAIGICFLYMIFLKISQAFGYNGDLDPLLTAWLANIIFLGAGLANLWRVPK
jgi:lipopolysaccharide export system permease protein